MIEQRIAAQTNWNLQALEPSSVIRYQPGHEYRSHVDYFTAEQIEHNKQQLEDFSGQRVVTFLICMVAPEQGGETLYDHAGVRISYHPRMAAMHYNSDLDGKPDPLSLHTGTPVTAGEKWLLRTTLREFSRYQS
jgi:prolyl 4-hydroxylase